MSRLIPRRKPPRKIPVHTDTENIRTVGYASNLRNSLFSLAKYSLQISPFLHNYSRKKDVSFAIKRLLESHLIVTIVGGTGPDIEPTWSLDMIVIRLDGIYPNDRARIDAFLAHWLHLVSQKVMLDAEDRFPISLDRKLRLEEVFNTHYVRKQSNKSDQWRLAHRRLKIAAFVWQVNRRWVSPEVEPYWVRGGDV